MASRGVFRALSFGSVIPCDARMVLASLVFFFFFGKKKKSPGLNRSGLSRELLALKTARQDPTWHLSGLPERGQIDKLSSSKSCQAFELNSSRYVK